VKLVSKFAFKFNLYSYNSASPPMLLRGAPFRELPRTCFASLIMYHVERRQAGEMVTVQAKLYDVARRMFPGQDAVALMEKWATWVRADFDSDNLHLRARQEDNATLALVGRYKLNPID
jgi:hypothetical protein